MLYAMLWYAMVWYDERDSMLWYEIPMLWYEIPMLCIHISMLCYSKVYIVKHMLELNVYLKLNWECCYHRETANFRVFLMALVPTFAWQVRYQNCLKSQGNTFVKTNYKYCLLFKKHGPAILNQIEKLKQN